MSRKTRKEKIIAELRRELKKGTASTRLSAPAARTSQTKKRVKHHVTKKPSEVASSKHVMLDLRKTVILSVIAVGLELGLYYYLK